MSIALFSAFCSLMVYTLSICFLTLTLDALSSTATSLKSKEWPVLDTCWNMFELIFFFYTSFLCSSVLSFNYRPVSPTYTALQSLQSILYTTPAWSSVWRLSFNLHISLEVFLWVCGTIECRISEESVQFSQKLLGCMERTLCLVSFMYYDGRFCYFSPSAHQVIDQLD
jgi:hypothetical protein